jgi:fusion and transport protein UGO1
MADRFSPPANREPNPLRPYYIPPSIGIPSSSINTSGPSNGSRVGNGGGSKAHSTTLSAARELLPDIDLDLKSTTGEAWQNTRDLLDTIAWRYTSVLLAQPFDVAKFLLQVSYPGEIEAGTPQRRRSPAIHNRGKRQGRRETHYNDEDDEEEDSEGDSDGDIPDYFSSAAPRSRSPRKRRRAPPDEDHDSLSPTPRPRNRKEPEVRIRLKKPESVLSAISALYNTSGAIGLWRASNTTFLYAILLRTTESFLRSLLLTVLGLPDIIGPDQGGLAPGLSVAGGAGFSGIDLSDSPNVLGSLVVVGMSSCLAGLILAPLDLVRTRLLITPMSHTPRGLVQNLRRLPSLVVPSTLWLPTALYHTVPNLFSAIAPLFLRRQLRITPDLTPAPWSLAAFVTSLTELFIRLPLETLVRRAQVSELQKSQPLLPLIVDPAPYAGVARTVYNIMYVEGHTTTKASNGMLRKRRGQGFAGLVRGWHMGLWGLIGVWGAGAMGPGDARRQGEF